MTVTATTTAPAAAAAATPANSLTTLGNNFSDFLHLLMTQLQNQDPTSPMDTNQFTSQLVQFTGVEQQINTNNSLTTLIQATQGSNLLQSSAMVGQTVAVTSDHLSLQNSQARVDFQAAGPGPVSIGVYSDSGSLLKSDTVNGVAGANEWSWNGADNNGNTIRDGSYKVIVKGADGSAVPFTVLGTATGVDRTSTAMKVQLGELQVDLNAVQSINGKGS